MLVPLNLDLGPGKCACVSAVLVHYSCDALGSAASAVLIKMNSCAAEQWMMSTPFAILTYTIFQEKDILE